jgi:hypothetical protein
MNCTYCNKPLPIFKYREGSRMAFSAELLTQLTTADGKPPKFGPDGNNAFCSKTCGFHWAVRKLRNEVEFDAAWRKCEEKGWCDAYDGVEYGRVRREWQLAGEPSNVDIHAFIRSRANACDDFSQWAYSLKQCRYCSRDFHGPVCTCERKAPNP